MSMPANLYLSQFLPDTTAYLLPSPVLTDRSPSTSPSPSPVSPISPLSSDSSVSSTSPNLSSEYFAMDKVEEVKNLLRMFPPPISARDFILKNPFKGPDGHIKRPSNNFILFRKIAHDQKNQTEALTEYNEREFSKIIGKIWDGLSINEKKAYKELGKEVAIVHKEMFPEYKYQPKRDKAAWKHFNPENNNSNTKIRNKRKNVKQQKHQETTPIISNIPNNIPKISISHLSQRPIISPTTFLQNNKTSDLDYSLPTTMSPEFHEYYPSTTTYANDNNVFSSLFSDDWNNNPLNYLGLPA